jgi:hypothetical protein
VTLAQVLPVVLLLTIVWDREWPARLPARRRRSSGFPGGVVFWRKPVVRRYSLALTALLLTSIGLVPARAGRAMDDVSWLRVALVAATCLASSATLCVTSGGDTLPLITSSAGLTAVQSCKT